MKPLLGGCALKDLIRLHAFSLVQYDAVVYFDTDVILVDDIMPLFRCIHISCACCPKANVTIDVQPRMSL